MRLLLVEDDPKIAHLVSQALVESGYETTVVDDGLAALDSAESGDGVGEVGEEMTLLLATGRRDSEDARDELIPVRAVRPEASFSQQDGRT